MSEPTRMLSLWKIIFGYFNRTMDIAERYDSGGDPSRVHVMMFHASVGLLMLD